MMRPEAARVSIFMGLDSALRVGVIGAAGAGASFAFISEFDESQRRMEPADLSAE